MMFKLLKRQRITQFVKMGTQTLMKQGTSLGVTIPKKILDDLGKVKGEDVEVHYNGDGKVLIDLTP